MSFLTAIAGSTPIIGDILNAVEGNANRQTERDIQAANQRSQQEVNQQNLDLAQHGISWKVADAAAAGISPLAALGATSPSMGTSVSLPETPVLDHTDYAKMGQDVGRALSAATSEHDRIMSVAAEDKAKADADLATTQAALAKRELLKQPGNPPVNPAVPSRNSDLIVGNADGTTSVVPARGMDLSGMPFIGPMSWYFHNKLMPLAESPAIPFMNYMLRKRGGRK